MSQHANGCSGKLLLLHMQTPKTSNHKQDQHLIIGNAELNSPSDELCYAAWQRE